MEAMNPVLAMKMGQTAAAPSKEGDGAVSPMRMMRRAMARAADKSVGLSASVLGISQEASSAEDMIEGAPDDWVVLGLRDGEEAGLTGLFLIDPAFRSALVEMQTMGNLLDAHAEQRKVTGTDATLSVPFAANLLAELTEVGFGDDEVHTDGYDIGPIADIRTAGLVLSQGSYRYWRVTVQMGGTDTQGELMIALRTALPAPVVPLKVDDEWANAFQKSVSHATAEMDAVLAVLKLPMSEVETFEVGQTVRLPGVTVGSVTLCGPAGVTIAQARLGQVAGKRAVRIEEQTIELQDTGPIPGQGNCSNEGKTLIDG